MDQPKRIFPRLQACALAFTVAALLQTPTAFAQKTQGEIDLEQARKAQQDRRDQAAATQGLHDQADAMRNRAQSDAAAMRALELSAPQRAAEARAAVLRDLQSRAAAEDAYQARQAIAMDVYRARSFKEEDGEYRAVAYDTHDWPTVIVLYDRLEAQGRMDDVAYAARALAKANLGLFPQALEDLDKAGAIDPKSTYNIAVRGEVQALRGEYAAANLAFDAAIAADPLSFESLYMRGVYRLERQDYAGAVADLSKASTIYSTTLRHLNDAKAALAVARKALAGSPPSSDTQLFDGQTITPCDRVAAAVSDDTKPRGIQGFTLATLNVPTAVSVCARALAAHSNDVRTMFELGRALTMTDRCPEGVELLKKAIDGGSGAAAFTYAVNRTKCPALGPSDPNAMMQKAFSLHNASAAIVLYEAYDQTKHDALVAKNDAAWNVAYKAALPYEDAMVSWLQPRAADGDSFAIQKRADFAKMGMINNFGINVIMACKVRSYDSCKDY
jgi:tetratricopeptide (TPR) repeat protein